jgi:Winged helix DNA-binding domain
MTAREIAHLRRASQMIASADGVSGGAVAARLGALQAQDTLGSLWAVGLRMAEATEVVVEGEVARGELVRTWSMRGTLHLVPARDAAWMIALTAPRAIAQAAGRARALELDDDAFDRARELVRSALSGGRTVSRQDLFDLLDAGGVSSDGQRGYHMIRRLAQEGLICHGPRDGKQPTLMLLADRVPNAVAMSRDEALTEFARRYFTSHGPATVQDFMWWSGLTAVDAKAGLAAASKALTEHKIGRTSYWMAPSAVDPPSSPMVDLLPAFDEYLLGYRDRDAMLDPAHAQAICPGSNGMFMPMIVIDGRIEGIWKRTLRAKSVRICPAPFRRLTGKENVRVTEAAERYGDFLGLPARVDWGE